MYNAEIVKIYKETKSLLQKYEDKLRKHRISLDSSSSDEENEVAEKASSASEAEPPVKRKYRKK